ncbi:MAG: hypothetical protein C4335_06550 [Armatimonadota bacterium]
MVVRFTDKAGAWRAVRQDTPFPVAGGQLLDWFSDEFVTAPSPDTGWQVSGSPSLIGNELLIASGTRLLSTKSFVPPCLIEAVITMTARASNDDFRVGFYQDDNNLVEWRASGTSTGNMDAMLFAGGTADHQTGIFVYAANNSYRLASIYVGIGEAVWSFRSINSPNTRNEVYRISEQNVPSGPFRIRLAGLAGTSTLKVHRVQAYQLADVIPPGALGHHVDNMALPVRLTNSPFIATPSGTGLGIVQTATDTFSALAAGVVGTGTSRSFFAEQTYLQAFFHGDQPFSWWVEHQIDGVNRQVIAYGTSTDATADAVLRYFAVSPLFKVYGARYFRVKVKNNGAAAGTFRGTMVIGVL